MASPRPRPALAKDLLALAGFVAASLAAGAIGGLATASSVTTWYATLNKPSFNPPNFLFAPVWTTLYVLMAVAAWRVWRIAGFGGQGRRPLLLYGAQLLFNLAWSLIFFGLKAPGPALAEVLVLLALIVVTAVAFWRLDRLAGLLFAPYILWVSFATLLNFEIWRLN